jgi:membrane fusion protein (multidrug efflux system)
VDTNPPIVPFRAPLGATAVLLLSLGPLGCGGPDVVEGADATPVPVRVTRVVRIDRPAWIGLSGEVQSDRTVNVGFLVPGLVAEVGPDEGDRVTRGAPLAELDATEYEFNLELAAAQRERAEDELARARAVFRENGIPENDLHKAEIAARMAGVQEAMAAKKLADTRITSPMNGIVARRAIQPGEQAGPGFPIFTIVSIDPVQVRVGVPEAEIGPIGVGQRADITVPSLDGAAFEGRVRLVGVAADPLSRTYTVKIEVANPGRRLLPGMIAEVRLQTDETVQALTVPGEAIVQGADGITRVFVYFPAEQRVHARRVEVGALYGTEIEIREGLSGEEQIVIGGQHRLREGSAVEVSASAAGPATDEGSVTR